MTFLSEDKKPTKINRKLGYISRKVTKITDTKCRQVKFRVPFFFRVFPVLGRFKRTKGEFDIFCL